MDNNDTLPSYKELVEQPPSYNDLIIKPPKYNKYIIYYSARSTICNSLFDILNDANILNNFNRICIDEQLDILPQCIRFIPSIVNIEHTIIIESINLIIEWFDKHYKLKLLIN
jgi:hypothetical protein